VAKDAVSIMQLLLVKDPKKRLGSGRGDADDVRAHAYFRSVNWDDVLYKRNPPPFIPKIVRCLDCSRTHLRIGP
jgi:serine/threonine protein kinase